LEIVHPDRAGLKQMTRSYGRPEQRESLLAVHARLAAISESEAATLQGSPATECWLDAARAHRALGQLPDALRCLRQALAGDMSHYETRHALARCLLDVEQFDEAEEHLHWCLQRKPRDAGLSQEMASAVEGRLRTTSLPARPAKSQDRRQ
jgi:tetratricopeptide (TPR) repeat protein